MGLGEGEEMVWMRPFLLSDLVLFDTVRIYGKENTYKKVSNHLTVPLDWSGAVIVAEKHSRDVEASQTRSHRGVGEDETRVG